MNLFKRNALLVSGLLVALSLVGCPSNNASTKNGNGGTDADKPQFKQHRTGVAKYDSYFQRVYQLRLKLWKADRQVNGVPGTLRSVLDTPGDVKKANTGDLLKAVVAKVGDKLSFRPGAGIGLKPGVNDPKAQKVAGTLDQVYQTTYKMPMNMGDAVGESKKLVIRGKQLTQSVPRDFTGLNALKAPSVTAALGESTTEMAKVPGQVATISKSSLDVAKQFPAVFRSKK